MDVFVSYATPDRERLAPIVEALEGEGWSVWWDRKIEAGTTFHREIQQALDSARCVLVAWTEMSVESDWVLAEAGDGLERGILIPLLLDSVRLPLAFRNTQAVRRENVVEAVSHMLAGAPARPRSSVVVVEHDTDDEEFRNRIHRIAGTFRGRVQKAGGNNLFQFPSTVGALRAALEMREKYADTIRIGVHCDERETESEKIGRGLASSAADGEIRVSDPVFQDVRRRLELSPEDLGEHRLPGAEASIRVYRLGQATPRLIARPVTHQPSQPQEIPTLAVLSFRNMNSDPDFEYFGDGIAVDVVEELLRIPRLQVVSTMSSFTYKKSTASAVDIGQELGVQHILEGSARQVGRQVRITAQLVRTSDGQVEWADHFDRPVDDVFAVQDEITRKLAEAMDVKFYLGEGAHDTHQLIRSSAARQKFYQAWELMNRLNKFDSERAKVLFEDAIRIEPESPLTYGILAWLNYLEMERGWVDSRVESVDTIRRLVDEALARNDRSGIGPMLAGYLSLLDGDHETALTTSKTVIQQRPSCPVAFSMRAGILNYSGDAVEAVEPAMQAMRLSPVVQPVYPEMLSLAYYLNGQLDEALESANETLSIAPDSVDARVVLVAALVESGRGEAACDMGVDILSLDPTFALSRYESNHPFRDHATLHRITSALRLAGLEEDRHGTATHGLAPQSRRRITPQRKR